MNITGTKKKKLWNKRHLEEREKNGECAACLKYSVSIFVEWIFKMRRLEVSCAVRLIYTSLGAQGLRQNQHLSEKHKLYMICHKCKKKTAKNERKITFQIQRKWLDNSRAVRTDEGNTAVTVKCMLCPTDTYWFLMYWVKLGEPRSVVLFSAMQYVRKRLGWFKRKPFN